MTFDKAAFYAKVRERLDVRTLTQLQVDGIEALLTACEGSPLAHASYMMATAWHETAHTMQPIKEFGGPSYFFARYDIKGRRPDKARELGNLQPGDGARFCGRGYVQLTGRNNYTKADEALCRAGMLGAGELLANPDLAMDDRIAAFVMRQGMEGGWFTGLSLRKCLPIAGVATHDQYVRARRIINGTDKSELIEDYAQDFERAFAEGGWR